MDSVKGVKLINEEINELKKAKAQTMGQAIKTLKNKPRGDNEDILSSYSLVTGRVIRGYTIARNSLKNEKRTMKGLVKPLLTIDETYGLLGHVETPAFTHCTHLNNIFFFSYTLDKSI